MKLDKYGINSTKWNHRIFPNMRRRWFVIIGLISIAEGLIEVLSLGNLTCTWKGDAMFGQNRVAKYLRSMEE